MMSVDYIQAKTDEVVKNVSIWERGLPYFQMLQDFVESLARGDYTGNPDEIAQEILKTKARFTTVDSEV